MEYNNGRKPVELYEGELYELLPKISPKLKKGGVCLSVVVLLLSTYIIFFVQIPVKIETTQKGILVEKTKCTTLYKLIVE